MSSDSEMSEFSDMSGNSDDKDVEEGNDEDDDVIYSEITPYQDEPLAQVDAGDENCERKSKSTKNYTKMPLH